MRISVIEYFHEEHCSWLTEDRIAGLLCFENLQDQRRMASKKDWIYITVVEMLQRIFLQIKNNK